jgi:hypothetical protein
MDELAIIHSQNHRAMVTVEEHKLLRIGGADGGLAKNFPVRWSLSACRIAENPTSSELKISNTKRNNLAVKRVIKGKQFRA